MPNWIFNELTISGPAEEIKRFKDGLLKVGDEFRLLQSYVPCPRKLIETEASWQEIGYETCFNPELPGGSRRFVFALFNIHEMLKPLKLVQYDQVRLKSLQARPHRRARSSDIHRLLSFSNSLF